MERSKINALQRRVAGLSYDEKLELALILIVGAKRERFATRPVDLNKYVGKAHFPIDGLEYQKEIRAK